MSLLWEILSSISIMGIVVFIALIPSSRDNLHYKRIERQIRRSKSICKKDASKFFKDNK